MSNDRIAEILAPQLAPPDARELLLAEKYGLLARGWFETVRLTVVAMAIAWAPLLALSMFEGTASGDAVVVTFLTDHTPHGRYLVALPLLILMDLVLARRMALTMENLHSSGLVRAEDMDRLGLAVKLLGSAWRSKLALGLFIALSFIAAFPAIELGRAIDMSNWMFHRQEGAPVSLAGAWNFFVSAPLLRVLMLRAFWKFGVWALFLVRLSKWNLVLNPLHPDCRCGLGFLGATQLAFLPIVCAVGVQFGCVVALAVRYYGQSLLSFKVDAVVVIALSVMLLLGPVLVFARRAWLARQRGEQAFTSWAVGAAAYLTERLDPKHLGELKEQLGVSEISSLTDASALFDRVLATFPAPIAVTHIVAVVGASILSIALPLLTLLPMNEIMRRLAEMLL